MDSIFTSQSTDPSSVESEAEVLIRVENVSKRFCRDLKKSLFYGIQDITYDLLGRERSSAELRNAEFLANHGVSFEVRRGECLGLIGHNGAGKTTLLKMLNGLIKPDVGKITMYGQVGALIALGAGFNPILTGRENVYIAGSVLGLSKSEVDNKYDEIVDFAELHDFMESPVQNYSSGMQVRLGFAVASSLNPDVLLIDEVLAVGDVGFRTKCYNRINQLKKTTAIIFVSHSMPQVGRLCSRALLLNKGGISFSGEVKSAIEAYHQMVGDVQGTIETSSDILIDHIVVNGSAVDKPAIIQGGRDFSFGFTAKFPERVKSIEVALYFQNSTEEIISQVSSLKQGLDISPEQERSDYKVVVPGLFLGSGVKIMTARIVDNDRDEILFWGNSFIKLVVENKNYVPCPVFHPAEFFVNKEIIR